MLYNRAISERLKAKYPFLSLVETSGGLISSAAELPPPSENGGPRFIQVQASLGNLTSAFPKMVSYEGNDLEKARIGGAGADENEETALVCAVAEAAERYACCVLPQKEVVHATANELKADALQFHHLSRCSDLEYAHPKCNLSPFDPDEPVRWIKGYSLVDRKERFVPLVMTHLYTREWQSERFWNAISTGVAAHTDPVKAIVSAINEVIERDAIALTWLLKIPLARILFDETPSKNARVKFQRLAKSRITQLFFDATTDIGVPTVYGLQLTDGHKDISQFVSCSTGFSMWENCAKVIRESACGRGVVDSFGPLPESFDDFVELEHGAAFMGRPESREGFDFLINSPRYKPISSFSDENAGKTDFQFKFLVDRFSALNMDVVLVDLTTTELRNAGLWAIRAVIPGLVPMSCVYRSRYLGHPRIYDYARQIGLDITESDINPYPQPFA